MDQRLARLLITGIPGTGKTSLGDYLANNHGLHHVDMEAGENLSILVQDRLNFIQHVSRKVVITWGFHPTHWHDVVFLKEQGFWLVWLDGDHTTALRIFNQRGTVSEAAFHTQVRRIEEQGVLAKIAPDAIIDPFVSGRFRPFAEIADGLIALWTNRNSL